MGLDGENCLASLDEYGALRDLAFEETDKLVRRGEYGMGSRTDIACRLTDAFGLFWYDVEHVFFDMGRRYHSELVDMGVIIPNPEYVAA